MAKDDYYTLVYKLLSYLYSCLKKEERPDWDKIAPNTRDFPIGEKYFAYLIEHLIEDGYIEGICKVCSIGAHGTKFKELDGGIKISPRGIEYLEDNGKMKKVGAMIGTASNIAMTVVQKAL